jgi:hypothetical protein
MTMSATIPVTASTRSLLDLSPPPSPPPVDWLNAFNSHTPVAETATVSSVTATTTQLLTVNAPQPLPPPITNIISPASWDFSRLPGRSLYPALYDIEITSKPSATTLPPAAPVVVEAPLQQSLPAQPSLLFPTTSLLDEDAKLSMPAPTTVNSGGVGMYTAPAPLMFALDADEVEARRHAEEKRKERERIDRESRIATFVNGGGMGRRVLGAAADALLRGRDVVGRLVEKMATTMADEETIETEQTDVADDENTTTTESPVVMMKPSLTAEMLRSPSIIRCLDDQPTLDLKKDLGHSSLKSALEARVHLRHLRKCPPAQVSGAALLDEEIDIDDLQTRYKLTLSDMVRQLRVDWRSLLAMGLSIDKMTRENGWFDVNVLSTDFIAQAGGNVVGHLGFNAAALLRLRCTDVEVAQLALGFDVLIQRCGLDRRTFLQLPWFPQTMIDLLGLQRSHLVDPPLQLRAKDFAFLRRSRPEWTLEMFRDQLKFTPDELVDLVGFDRAVVFPQPTPEVLPAALPETTPPTTIVMKPAETGIGSHLVYQGAWKDIMKVAPQIGAPFKTMDSVDEESQDSESDEDSDDDDEFKTAARHFVFTPVSHMSVFRPLSAVVDDALAKTSQTREKMDEVEERLMRDDEEDIDAQILRLI